MGQEEDDDDQYVTAWHIRYEYPDGSVLDRPEEDPKKGLKTILLAGVASLAIGVGIGAFVGVRLGAGSDPTVKVPMRGVSLAGKAFMYGTVWAVAGVGALTWGTAYVLDAKSWKEFGTKMRASVPGIMPDAKPLRDFMEQSVQTLKKDQKNDNDNDNDNGNSEGRKKQEKD
jgi:hypothetical protein